jgi:DNA polymerase eta
LLLRSRYAIILASLPHPAHDQPFFDRKMAICFTVVEQRRNPALRGQPTAVVQYNDWKGGGLIAVSYEARGFGVKR